MHDHGKGGGCGCGRGKGAERGRVCASSWKLLPFMFVAIKIMYFVLRGILDNHIIF